MKIEFTQYRKLDDLGRDVIPGDTLCSGPNIDDRLLAAYVQNGIAKDATPQSASASSTQPAEPPAPAISTEEENHVD